jgi:chromosome segregation ATPase
MAEFKKTLAEMGRQVARWAKTGGSSAAEWWDEKSAIQKRAAQMRKLNRQRQATVAGIGAKVYALHRRGKVRNRDLLADCQKIDEVDAEMERLKGEIEEIKRRKQQAAAEPAELEDDAPVVDESDIEERVAIEVEEPGEEEEEGAEVEDEGEAPEAVSGEEPDESEAPGGLAPDEP